jgi:hypothetical protein
MRFYVDKIYRTRLNGQEDSVVRAKRQAQDRGICAPILSIKLAGYQAKLPSMIKKEI